MGSELVEKVVVEICNGMEEKLAVVEKSIGNLQRSLKGRLETQMLLKE